MATIITEAALLRLLQLGSVSLPVGGFAYSQGLESAIDAGWLGDAADCEDWLRLQLRQSIARVDLAILFRIYPALERCDSGALGYWNRYLLACRETRELRLTDAAMGQALQRLLPALGVQTPALEEACFVTAFCSAAWHWGIAQRSCALALCWSWLENQVAAATKLVPLGQTRAQVMLGNLQQDVPGAIDLAQALADEDIGGALPALALASTFHETQYSRLFRS
jgi:urease accessory protein